MSEVQTNGSNANATPGAGHNNPPDDYNNRVFAFLGSLKHGLQRVQRMEQAIYQTVIALFFALAEHGGELPPVQVKRTVKKISVWVELKAKISADALIACDGTEKERSTRGVSDLYEVLCVHLERKLEVEEKTARDIALLAARMYKAGYRLADWNGKLVEDKEGNLSTEMDEPSDDTAYADYPGVFRIKAPHLFGHPDAELAEIRKVPSPKVPGELDDVPFPAERQLIPLYDHWVSGLKGKENLRSRVGRQSVLNGIAKYDEAVRAQAIVDAETARKAKEKSEREAAQATGDKSTPEDVKERQDGKANDLPPDSTPKGDDKPQDAAGKGDASGNTDASQANDNKPVDAKPNDTKPNDSGQDRRDGGNESRGDDEKMAAAMTPGATLDHCLAMFTAGRVKDDPQVKVVAMQVFARLHGILRDVGLNEFVNNPTPATLKAGARLDLAKIKPATAAQHNKRTGK